MSDGGAVKSIFPWADQPKEKYILTRTWRGKPLKNVQVRET